MASQGSQEGRSAQAESPTFVLVSDHLDAPIPDAPAVPRKSSLIPASNRDSRASFASTNRTSTADSVFSSRISTVSVSTSVRPVSGRQSSLDSGPPSAISPWETDKGKDAFHRYFCTSCDLSFPTKAEWRAHELSSHSETEYICRACNTLYTQESLLIAHLQEVHSQTTSSGSRRAWGCGFCAATRYSHESYLDHVSVHFDEDKERAQWLQVSVIKALLHQPKLREAWDALVSEQEASRGSKLRFKWDERSALTLQNILECFVADTDDPVRFAEVAYDAAEVKSVENVSGQYTNHGGFSRVPRRPDISPASLTGDILLSPDTITNAPDFGPSVGAPRLPRPLISSAPYSSHIAKKPYSLDSAPKVLARIEEATPSSPDPGRDSPGGEISRHPLRRVESDWNLGLLKPGDTAGIVRPRTASPLRAMGLSTRKMADEIDQLMAQSSVQEPELSPRRHTGFEDWVSIPKLSATSSRRTPSGSSFRSAPHTPDHSRYDNSASECVSDDSLSEPDCWLEFDDKSEPTKEWARAYQYKVDLIMELLWARYNRDWDALITKCVGEQSQAYSQGNQGERGRAQNLTTYPTGYSLQPLQRKPVDDRDEDEEMEGRPVSSQSKRGSPSSKRYACPFRKHDPQVYNIHDHDICALRSWETVSRVKEHLYRKHCKIHCPRCKQTFRRAGELEAHEMQPEGCEVRSRNPPADITAKQEKQLKSKRYATRYQTEEEKWREVYRLLFPGEPVPSPYPELAPDIRPVSSDSQNNMGFQLFLLTEMPQIFRQRAAAHHNRYMEDHDTLTMESVNAILKESINQAFQDWETTGGSVPRHFTPSSIMQDSMTTSPNLAITTPSVSTGPDPPFIEYPVTMPYWPGDQLSQYPVAESSEAPVQFPAYDMTLEPYNGQFGWL